MLQRRLGGAALLLANGQGAALLQGFRRQQWQSGAAATAAAPPLSGSPEWVGLRWHSELTEQPKEQQGQLQDYEYVAPFGTAVGRVKKLSLFSCACAIAAGPVILGLDTGTSLTAKASIVATLASFGIFTTGLLTWFTQPYVQRLRYEAGTDTVETTTLSLLAQPRIDRFHLNEIRETASVHPLTSFEARGRRYYVDSDNFPNKPLLVRLVPQAAAAATIEAANADVQQRQQQAQQQASSEQQAPPQQQ